MPSNHLCRARRLHRPPLRLLLGADHLPIQRALHRLQHPHTTTLNRKATTMTTTNPLRLAVGSHQAGSGKGCAMNLISWENGDTKITDMPDCSDQLLTRIVQRVNDTICNHRDGDLLCAPCSLIVLALGHRTVGTGKLDLTDLERRVIWVRIAADQARQVQHLNADLRDDAAILAAEAWADNPTYAAAHAATAAYAAANAANYASNASTPDQRLNLAQRAIDLFEQLTSHVAPAVDEAVTRKALESMLA